ncbi:MAG: carbohydrate kinase family protein [Bacilli bacterium]|nr:carbohydrate kinase family protein [Bacilli bacterium]
MNKILVIGGSNIDYIGKSYSSIREKDSNIGNISISFGGVARNICENLARLGMDVTFITAVGKDLLAEKMIKELQMLGIKIFMPVISDYATGGYLAIHDSTGDMVLALCDQSIMKSLSPQYLSSISLVFNEADYIVVDTSLEKEAIDYIIDKYQNKKIIVDTISTAKVEKIKDRIGNIDYLKCNLLEAKTLIGKDLPKDLLIKEFQKKHAKTVIITDGAEDIYYLDDNMAKISKIIRVSDEEIVNVTGVGDAMLSGIIYGLVNKKELKIALELGKKLATLTLLSNCATNKNITKESVE